MLIPGFIVLVFIFAALFVSTIKIVPQGSTWIVERFGKYRSTLQPGLQIIVPYVDRVAYKMSTKDELVEVPTVDAITRDNAVVNVSSILFVRVVDARQCAYGVNNYATAIIGTCGPLLRNIIGGYELNECLSSREKLKLEFKTNLEEQFQDWGIQMRSVDLQEINPSPSMQAAMEQQAAAERERKATETRAAGNKQAAILEAEGLKQGQILEAEARREAAKADADAQRTLAQGTKDATAMIAEAANEGKGAEALSYLLGQRYIESIGSLAESKNAKSVFIPADLKGAVAPFASAGAGWNAGTAQE